MSENDSSTTGIEQVAVGLIRLKCLDCKNEYIARLDRYCYEADSAEYIANPYCAGCEGKDPLRKLEVRTLDPGLVEKQRIDPNCFEADRSVDTGTEHSEGKR